MPAINGFNSAVNFSVSQLQQPNAIMNTQAAAAGAQPNAPQQVVDPAAPQVQAIQQPELATEGGVGTRLNVIA